MVTEKTKFLRKCTAFIGLLIFVILIYLILCSRFSYTPNMIIWDKESYDLKDNISKNIEEQKIVILSGSNGHFGISAEEMTKELGIKTVNYALDFSLGTYSFEKAKKILKKGDIVFMPLEYEFYWYNEKNFFDEQPAYARYILTYDKEYYSNLSILKKMRYTLVQFDDLLCNIMSRYILPTQVYESKTINQFGDETNYSNPSSLENINPLSIPEDFSLNKYDGPKKILEFADWCKENNVHLIASFPSTIYFEEYKNKEYQDFLSKIIRFYSIEKIDLLGNPEDFFYEKNLFYDTIYHLNQEGKKVRTKFIIDELKLIINKSKLPRIFLN